MSSISKVLILGGSSFLGQMIYKKLGIKKSDITYFSKIIKGGYFFDATKHKISETFQSLENYSHAIILLGQTSPDYCKTHINESYRLNVICIKLILDDLKTYNIVPVFCSTEAVFDGSKGDYRESDLPNPILEYSKQKVEVENYIKSIFDDYQIIRLSKIYGLDINDKSLLSSWLEQIKNNDKIKCAIDQIFSPIEVSDAVDMMIELINLKAKGIINISGPQSYTRIEILRILIREYERYYRFLGSIIELKISDFNTLERRPLNISLNSELVQRLTKISTKSIDLAVQILISNYRNQIQ